MAKKRINLEAANFTARALRDSKARTESLERCLIEQLGWQPAGHGYWESPSDSSQVWTRSEAASLALGDL